MDVNEGRVGAARDAASALVAQEHGATQSGRNGLLGARCVSGIDRLCAHVGLDRCVDVMDGTFVDGTAVGRLEVGDRVGGSAWARVGGSAWARVGFSASWQDVTELLRIALCHRDDRLADGDDLSSCDLFATAAGGADTERHLIARATVIAGCAQHLTSHRQQHGVVIPLLSRRAPVGLHRLPKEGERLRRVVLASRDTAAKSSGKIQNDLDRQGANARDEDGVVFDLRSVTASRIEEAVVSCAGRAG